MTDRETLEEMLYDTLLFLAEDCERMGVLEVDDPHLRGRLFQGQTIKIAIMARNVVVRAAARRRERQGQCQLDSSLDVSGSQGPG